MAWKSVRPPLKVARSLLLTAALLVMGALLHDFVQEWHKTRRELAALEAKQQRGYIGLLPAKSEAPPPDFLRQREGRWYLWAKSGRARAGWYDVTDCLLPAAHFHYLLNLHQGVDVPVHVSANHAIARRLAEGDAVVGISLDGSYCAYPEFVLKRAVVINDELAGRPVAVVHFPFSALGAVAFHRDVDGVSPKLELTGYVYENRPILYDRQSESLWYPEKDGRGLRAISGPFAGRRMPQFAALRPVSWKNWRDDYASTRLLVGADRGTLSNRGSVPSPNATTIRAASAGKW